MYIAQIANANGESLTLSQNERKWQIISITGLNPPNAQVNTTNIAGMDGAQFNSSKLDTRNIVILLKINGNIEQNRQELYRFFRTKKDVTFYFSNNRNVMISGVIETIECNLFENGETMQISIICPNPYFKALYSTTVPVSNESALFTFPFSIDEPIPFSSYSAHNVTEIYAETETGIKIEVDILDSVNKIEIMNATTGDFMLLTYQFVTDDVILISTNSGEKSVILARNGERINLFTALDINSHFLSLATGVNRFEFAVDDGTKDDDVAITFTYRDLYEAV